MMHSYCDFLVLNWNVLEIGNYKALNKRPEYTYKKLLDEIIIKDCMPELSKEEKMLTAIDSMDI
jgi:hypothetical protein